MGFTVGVGAGASAGELIGIPTVAALRARGGNVNDVVALLDGGRAGVFQWNPAASPDNGVTRYNAGAGNVPGWERIYSGPLDVRWGGAIGDGIIDDTIAVQGVIDAAISGNSGAVLFPAGLTFRITAQILIESMISLLGIGSPAGGVAGSTNNLSTILHDFDGDLFVFNGANGGATASGGGVENLRLVQVFSDAPPASRGAAIVFTGTGAANRVAWPKVRNCIIEEDGGDPWTYGINIAGTAALDIPDFWITETSMHISAGGTAAIRVNNGSGRIDNCSLFLAGANVVIGDVDQTNSVQLDLVDISGTLIIDNAADISYFNGICGAITTTANTVGKCTFIPGRLVTPYTSAAQASVGVWQYVETALGAANGSWRSNKPICLLNSQHLVSLNAAGTNILTLIGLDVNSITRLGLSTVVAIGNPATTSGSAIGDIVLANTGNVIFNNAAGTGALKGISADATNFIRTGFDATSAGLKSYAGGNLLFQVATTGCKLYANGGANLRIEAGNAGVGFNAQAPAIPNITGALSAVTDVNAKNVLTSIIAALKNAAGGVGLVTDGTT